MTRAQATGWDWKEGGVWGSGHTAPGQTPAPPAKEKKKTVSLNRNIIDQSPQPRGTEPSMSEVRSEVRSCRAGDCATFSVSLDPAHPALVQVVLPEHFKQMPRWRVLQRPCLPGFKVPESRQPRAAGVRHVSACFFSPVGSFPAFLVIVCGKR